MKQTRYITLLMLICLCLTKSTQLAEPHFLTTYMALGLYWGPWPVPTAWDALQNGTQLTQETYNAPAPEELTNLAREHCTASENICIVVVKFWDGDPDCVTDYRTGDFIFM